MNHQLIEIHRQRGRLLERIAGQRAALSRDLQPVRASLSKVDRVVGRIRSVTDYIKRHPSIAALAVAGLFVMKTERTWRWTKRAFFAWRAWRAFGNRLTVLSSRAR